MSPAAIVSSAQDAERCAMQGTTTVDADGSTTIDNRALDSDGRLANETISTTSADGSTRTIAFDDPGNDNGVLGLLYRSKRPFGRLRIGPEEGDADIGVLLEVLNSGLWARPKHRTKAVVT